MPNKKKQLDKSKVNKNNEYYTLLEDIENEIKNYWPQLEGKKIWCNCDDPEWSNFHHYFEAQKAFHKFEVKYTCYNLIPKNKKGYEQVPTQMTLFDRTDDDKFIKTNQIWLDKWGFCEGDFRSPAQEELWKWADVIITNPPFTLFREFIDKLMNEKKQFIIIGPQNAISYRNVFSFIKENQIWLGYNFHLLGFWMINSDGERIFLDAKKENGAVPRACCWFTNLDVSLRHKKMILTSEYNMEDYPKFDNYDAININSSKDIPCDYFKPMGVPITFLSKYNPDQFEILDAIGRYSMLTGPTPETKGKYLTMVNGKPKFARVIIRRK